MSRVYLNFKEAHNELARDLKEMGVKVENNSRHDKYDDNPDYHTLELLNNMYTVMEPKLSDLNPIQPWADAEWEERLNGILGKPQNPGRAIALRSDDGKDNHEWRDYIEVSGKPVSGLKDQKTYDQIFKENDEGDARYRFSYTYPERFALVDQGMRIIEELKKHPLSRQLWLSIWDPNKDPEFMGTRRVPCTIGYHFIKRQGALNINYVMRSCEYGTHFQNDCYLAMKLLHFVADKAGLKVGTFTHTVFSMHVYERNVKDLF